MSYEFGDIVLVEFPQTSSSQRKKRPALVVLDTGDADVVLAPITSRERSGPGDCKLTDWQGSGLLRESWVRLAKIACLEKRDISRRLGSLTDSDRSIVCRVGRDLYSFSKGP